MLRLHSYKSSRKRLTCVRDSHPIPLFSWNKNACPLRIQSRSRICHKSNNRQRNVFSFVTFIVSDYDKLCQPTPLYRICITGVWLSASVCDNPHCIGVSPELPDLFVIPYTFIQLRILYFFKLNTNLLLNPAAGLFRR